MEFSGYLRREGEKVGVYYADGEYDTALCGRPVKVWVEINGEKVHLPYRIVKRDAFGGHMWKSQSDGVMYNSLLFCVDNLLPHSLTYYR